MLAKNPLDLIQWNFPAKRNGVGENQCHDLSSRVFARNINAGGR